MTIKLWSVLGNSQKLDGGAMFGNVPRLSWPRVRGIRALWAKRN